MGNDVRVHLDCHWEHGFLPLVDFGKLEDVAVKLGDGGVEVGGFFAKQRYNDGGIIDNASPQTSWKLFPKSLYVPEVFLNLNIPSSMPILSWSWKAS